VSKANSGNCWGPLLCCRRRRRRAIADSLPCTRTQPFIYIYKMTQPPLKIRGKVECARHSLSSPASRLSARMDALRVLADLALVGVALLFLWRGASNAVVAWRSSKRKLGKQD
jgi:hypothetical protein